MGWGGEGGLPWQAQTSGISAGRARLAPAQPRDSLEAWSQEGGPNRATKPHWCPREVARVKPLGMCLGKGASKD